jgi:ABC-2 type transport system permease protein
VLGAMSTTATIATKELAELKATKSTVGMGFLSVLFFVMVVSGDETAGLDISTSGLLVVRPLFAGLFGAYYGASQVFLREKTDDIVETLLCSPATLRQLWLGKTLGVATFATAFAIVAALVTLAIPIAQTGEAVIPDGATVLYLVVALPLVLACAVGARGQVQLLMGMRESHIVSLAVVIALVVALGAVGFVGLSTFAVSTDRIMAMAFVAAAILAFLTWTAGRLSRERIVTSL